MGAIVLPVRVIALAACEAAKIHGEDAADAFDEDCASRARCAAIAAIRRIYPTVSQIAIAKHFGCDGSAKQIGVRMQNARLAAWWKDEDVSRIAAAIAPHCAIERADEPRVELPEDVIGAAFQPRPRGTPIAKIRNVTAQLMGDPPPGRRDFLAGNPHCNFAGVENVRKGCKGSWK